jgi:glycolate oxidase iron-sulfur subunit
MNFPEDRRFQELSSRVMEVSQYLNSISRTTSDERPEAKRVKVTYHDPCHLNRELGIKREPREILKAIPGIELVEMGNASRCCGSGGSFNLAHYDLSLKILEKKMEDIRNTGAEVVVTSCSGCMLQLKDGAHHKGMKVEVLHLTEVLQKFA